MEQLLDKMKENDKHLRIALTRLQQENIKVNQLQVTLQQREAQLFSCLEVAERVCKHLEQVQHENDVWRLDRFDKEEFQRNYTVIKHIKAEWRPETELDFSGAKDQVLELTSESSFS
jgi:hypothetical protein